MSTSFSTKCEILSEVHLEADWNPELQDFKMINDIGLPLAHLSHINLCSVTDEGVKYVEETWQSLSKILKVDPNKEYKNSDEILKEAGFEG